MSSDAPTPDNWAIQELVETVLVLRTESKHTAFFPSHPNYRKY
jgi:hypothetical protein